MSTPSKDKNNKQIKIKKVAQMLPIPKRENDSLLRQKFGMGKTIIIDAEETDKLEEEKDNDPTETIKNKVENYLMDKQGLGQDQSECIAAFVDNLYNGHPRFGMKYERVLKFPSAESEQQLKRYLAMANKSLSVCMYTFTNRVMMNALIEANCRGVRVRVITDKESLSTLYIHELSALGIKWTHHNLTNTAKMHHKFAIVDDFLLINGSLNWTVKGTKQNHENVMVSGSQVYIQEFKVEFEKLWNQYEHNILSQEDSQSKVTKERAIQEKKRQIKENDKKIKIFEKRIAQIAHKYVDIKQKCWASKEDNMIDFSLSVALEKEIEVLRSKAKDLQEKRNKEKMLFEKFN